MKPRILLLITRAGLGGAQRSTLELARELGARGHDISLATGENGWLTDEVSRLGYHVKRLTYLARSKNPLKVVLFTYEIYRYLGEHPVDAMHLNSTNTLPAALAGHLRGVRTVFTARGLSMLDEAYETNIVAMVLYRIWFWLWFWFIDEVVCVSTRNAERLDTLHLVHGPVTVIPNGLNPNSFSFLSRTEARAALGVREDELVAVLVGRLEYAKRQSLLIEAWLEVVSRKPDAKLILIGDGPDEETLRSQVKDAKLEDNVIFFGPYAGGHRILRGADLVLLSSRYEGWPIVLLEALAAGSTIVASDVGGIREQIGDAGVILPSDASPHMWAVAISDLLQEAGRRDMLGARARERTELWTAERMVTAYEGLYEAR